MYTVSLPISLYHVTAAESWDFSGVERETQLPLIIVSLSFQATPLKSQLSAAVTWYKLIGKLAVRASYLSSGN